MHILCWNVENVTLFPEQVKVHRTPDGETEALVYLDRAFVVATHMQKRLVTLFVNEVDLVLAERARISSAEVVGMGAYCAHFAELFDMHSLSGHCHELIVFENAMIVSKFYRS